MAIQVPAKPFSLVAHVPAAAAAGMVLVWSISFRGGFAWESSNKSLIFNLHPALLLIGFGDHWRRRAAILSYKSLPLGKETKKLVHLVLHAIALVLGIIGIYAAFKNHNEKGIANLYSLHSWLGIAIIVLYGIQWIYGFIIFFYPGARVSLRSSTLPWHVLFGLFVYILAVGNAVIGFQEKITLLEKSGVAKYGPEAFLVNFTAVVTILYGAFVMMSVLGQASGPEDDFSYSAI